MRRISTFFFIAAVLGCGPQATQTQPTQTQTQTPTQQANPINDMVEVKVAESYEYAILFDTPVGGAGVTERHHVIVLTIHNTTQTRKIDFKTWLEGKSVFVGDEHGNKYSSISFGRNMPRTIREGGGHNALHQYTHELHPGAIAKDVVVVQKPIPVAKRLQLHLPRTNFGGDGDIILPVPVPAKAK